jgi:5-formyltetrahydrofolate cyclo-ligase
VSDIKQWKASVRKQMLKRRAGLGKGYRVSADQAILKRILGMESYRQANVLFTYVSMEGEVDTREVILRALADGKQVAVPRCGKGGIMSAHRIKSMEELRPGAFGILEPVESCEETRPEDMEFVLVPCVCCCGSGVRLGYGGGYYDRFLPGTPAVRAALCWEKMMAEDIPREKHDCAMDFVVTEERVIEYSR